MTLYELKIINQCGARGCCTSQSSGSVNTYFSLEKRHIEMAMIDYLDYDYSADLIDFLRKNSIQFSDFTEQLMPRMLDEGIDFLLELINLSRARNIDIFDFLIDMCHQHPSCKSGGTCDIYYTETSENNITGKLSKLSTKNIVEFEYLL